MKFFAYRVTFVLKGGYSFTATVTDLNWERYGSTLTHLNWEAATGMPTMLGIDEVAAMFIRRTLNWRRLFRS